tara:strand:- start:27485 stop:28396 length:912 start_codon:yes stop_codon:yes gene_type:complete
MLAIIIPFYKLTYFEETLQSLANQTDKRFKVYIGDDSSPENPLDLLGKFKEKFDFVYYKFDKNVGGISLVKQWDRCIALSQKEEWLMILGDDDYLGENAIALWYKNYNEFYKKAEVIRFATKAIDQKKKEISEAYEHPVWEYATDAFLRKYYYSTRSSLSEYIFSKESYNKYGFYDYSLAWYSDDRAWLDFSDNKPIFTINESIIFIRFSELSISGKADNDFLKNQSKILFYRYLIKRKLNLYKKKERLIFLRRYENDILKTRKLSYLEWLFLLNYYIKYFEFDAFKKYSKRFLNTLLKRHEE